MVDLNDDIDDFEHRVTAKAAEALSSDRIEHAKRILHAFETWRSEKEVAKEENKRCSDNVKRCQELLAEAMTQGHSTPEGQVAKLGTIELAWQELDEAKAEQKDVRGAWKDAIDASETKIRDLIEEGNQLRLFTDMDT